MVAVALALMPVLASAAVAAGPQPDAAPAAPSPRPDAAPGSGGAGSAPAPAPVPRVSTPAVAPPVRTLPSPSRSARALAPPATVRPTPVARRAVHRRSRPAPRRHARRTEKRAKAGPIVPARPPHFAPAVAPIVRAADSRSDTALLAAALGLCVLALPGAVLVGRVRREAGIA